MSTRVLRPDRIRRLEAPFSWFPATLLSCAAFEAVPAPAKLLYCFLCLVSDKKGISYWGRTRIAKKLSLNVEHVADATRALCSADLIAFDGQIYQVLSLPKTDDGDKQARPEASLNRDQPEGRSWGPAAMGRVETPEQVRTHVQRILAQLGKRS